MKSVLISILCIGIFLPLNSEVFPNEQNGTLKIMLSGFKNNKGKASLALFNSEESYKNPKGFFRGIYADIKDGKAEAVFKDLPQGTYAVKAYHDENNNDKLDTGAFGIPKELYGFSNNARGKFGPAKWEDAKFSFNKQEMIITVALK